MQKQSEIVICKNCGKTFESPVWRRAVYCSRECSGKGQIGTGKVITTCPVCNQPFESDRWKKHVYCSKKCSGLAKRREQLVGICINCGKEFSYRSCTPDTKFCSKSCAGAAKRARSIRKCLVCGKDFYPIKPTSHYCSKECKYASYPRQGYKEIYSKFLSIEEQKKFAPMFKKGRCHEHRLIMARHLGRPVEKYEIVHHINGNKRDNRISNLELVVKTSHHKGCGDDYYQKWQEANERIKELEAMVGSGR